MNFFTRIYLAITDFRLYPYIVQKEKFSKALLYFLSFMLLVSAILSAGVTAKVLNWTNDFMLVYDSKVEDFSIKDGELIVSQNMDFEFDDVHVYSDDTKVFEDLDFNAIDKEKDDIMVLALKDTFSIGNENLGFVSLKYSDLSVNIDKQQTYDILNNALNSYPFKFFLTLSIFCGVFVAYLLTKFINVIAIAIMLLFLGYVFRTKHKFREYIEVAFYVITLPVITEVIALMVTGEINEYANITYFLLTYVYMYYAIRALKLDNIIMSTQEKIMGMKLENDLTQNEEKKDNINNEQKQEVSHDNEKKEQENKPSSNENDDENKSE